MAKGDVHTVPHGNGWANKIEGNKRVSNTAKTQAAAAKKGQGMARKAGREHLVHRRDGTIGRRSTYPRSRDPRGSRA